MRARPLARPSPELTRRGTFRRSALSTGFVNLFRNLKRPLLPVGSECIPSDPELIPSEPYPYPPMDPCPPADPSAAFESSSTESPELFSSESLRLNKARRRGMFLERTYEIVSNSRFFSRPLICERMDTKKNETISLFVCFDRRYLKLFLETCFQRRLRKTNSCFVIRERLPLYECMSEFNFV